MEGVDADAEDPNWAELPGMRTGEPGMRTEELGMQTDAPGMWKSRFGGLFCSLRWRERCEQTNPGMRNRRLPVCHRDVPACVSDAPASLGSSLGSGVILGVILGVRPSIHPWGQAEH